LSTKVERISEFVGEKSLLESDINKFSKGKTDGEVGIENEHAEFQRSHDNLITMHKNEVNEMKSKFGEKQSQLELKIKDATNIYKCLGQDKDVLLQEVKEKSGNFDSRLNQIKDGHNSHIDSQPVFVHENGTLSRMLLSTEDHLHQVYEDLLSLQISVINFCEVISTTAKEEQRNRKGSVKKYNSIRQIRNMGIQNMNTAA
jgi:hypothetical protein